MKHFWLDDGQQAIMDAATSTASDYGAVGLVYVDLNSQKQVRDLTGTDVAKSDQLRIHKITHNIAFAERGKNSLSHYSSAIRLTKNQAMLLKLRKGGSVNIVVVEDSTGETWGNMQIALVDRRKFDWNDWQAERYRRFNSRTAYQCFSNLIDGVGFAPTLAAVGNACKGMPSNWARCFVWKNLHTTHLFQEPLALPDAEVIAKGAELTPPDKMVLCRELLDIPLETRGQAAARLFAQDVQRFAVRDKFGIDGELGPILD